MDGVVVGGSTYRAQLAVGLPEGWTVSEGLTMTSPSGTQIRARVDRAPGNQSAAQLTARQLDETSVTLEQLKETSAEDVLAFGRIPSHARLFSFRSNDRDCRGIVTSAIVGPVAISAAASWLTDAASDADEMAVVERVISDLHLVETDESLHVSHWSEEELAVLASIQGFLAFPTVAPGLLESMNPTVSEAVIESVIRSLGARSLLRSDGEKVEPVGELAQLAGLAFGPSVTLSFEQLGRSHRSAHWYGATADSALLIDVLANGVRSCRIFPAGDLVDVALGLSGLAVALDDVSSADGPLAAQMDPGLDRLTREELLGDVSPVDRLVQIQAHWKEGHVIVSGLVNVAVSTGWIALAEPEPSTSGLRSQIDISTAVGSLSVAEPQSVVEPPTAWSLRQVSEAELRSVLVAHLPSGPFPS